MWGVISGPRVLRHGERLHETAVGSNEGMPLAADTVGPTGYYFNFGTQGV